MQTIDIRIERTISDRRIKYLRERKRRKVAIIVNSGIRWQYYCLDC